MEKAYDFKLNDSEGNEVALHDFLGQKVVVYFYPKDSTPGCTKQACSYRDHFTELAARNLKVIGISKDSATSHQKFIAKQSLNFTLLSDPDHIAIEARADLIEHNLRLVAHIVKKFDIRREQTEDLISIGTIGLIKGIDTFKVD